MQPRKKLASLDSSTDTLTEPQTMKKNPNHFTGIDHLLETVSRPPHWTESTKGLRSESTGEAKWNGTESWEEAMDFARNGWPQGLEMIKEARSLSKVPESVASLISAPTIAEEGDEVLVDRFLDGESDCWLDFPPSMTPTRGRIVQIFVHVGGLGGVPMSSFVNRGAATMCLVDALESAGYRVDLWIMARNKNNGKTQDMRCQLKRPEDHLDMDRLAFWTMNPAVHRRFNFRMIEQRQDGKSWIPGYGSTVAIPDEDLPAGAYQIRAPHGHLSPEDAARRNAKIIASLTA